MTYSVTDVVTILILIELQVTCWHKRDQEHIYVCSKVARRSVQI